MPYVLGLSALRFSIVEEVFPHLPPHLHPPGVIQMEHPPGILLSPVLLSVSGPFHHPDLAKPVLLLIADLPDPKSGEVGHLDEGLLVQLLNLLVKPLHVLVLVVEVRGAGTPARQPAQLWGVEEGGDGTGVFGLWVMFLALVFDYLDKVVIVPHDGLRALPMEDVVEACNNDDVHGPALIVVVNLPGLHQVKHLCTRYGDILGVDCVSLIDGSRAAPGCPELMECGGGDADLHSARLDSGVLCMHALTGRTEVGGGLLSIERPDKFT